MGRWIRKGRGGLDKNWGKKFADETGLQGGVESGVFEKKRHGARENPREGREKS